jgi:acetoin utilization deacetylase AcuC-like enzyme
MGFCFFNNVAVGVAHALQTYSVSRVAILDFDVHDCNGTIDIFKDDTRVLICSSFEHPLFPYTGTNSLSERIVRVPLEPYSTGAVFREAIAQRWIPCVEAFQPELIFVSAGFDGHVEDDMSDLALVDDDYRWITELIVELAERFAQGRIISTLEGGYNLDSLARAATVHVRALMGQ